MSKKRIVRLKLRKVKRVEQPPEPTNEMSYDMQRGVSYSRLQSFLACRQKCKYECQGWKRIESKESLTFGGLFHFVLEQLYEHVKGERPSQRLHQQMVKNLPDLLEGWLEDARADAFKRGGDGKMIERCEALVAGFMPAYVRFHSTDFTRRKWIGAEKEFRVNFKGFWLFGYRDGMFEEDGKLDVLETKTKAAISVDLNDAVGFDAQNLMYALATEIELHPRRVHQVLYNVIRKPQWRMDKLTDAQIEQRALKESSKDPKGFFVRYPVVIRRKNLIRFKHELEQKLIDFQAWLNGELPTYRNEGACITKWSCPFIRVCATGSFLGYDRRK